MIKIYFTKTKAVLQALAFLFFSFNVGAQCPTGNVLLSNQSEVDAFGTNYPNCTKISGYLKIQANSSTDITNISALSKITSVEGNLEFNNNTLLSNIAPLSNLITVGGSLAFANNNLQNLNALSSLKSIGGYLWITDNNSLTNLNGLENITTIQQTIYIEANAVLNNISALQKITLNNPAPGYGLTLVNNPLLAVCNLPNFCSYLANPSSTHPRIISGNLANCLDEAAVKTACGLMSVTDIDKSSITVYPNPVKSVLNFSEEVSNIKITDISGRTVKQISISTKTIDVANLANGAYIITATTKAGNTITKKLVKE